MLVAELPPPFDAPSAVDELGRAIVAEFVRLVEVIDERDEPELVEVVSSREDVLA